MCSIHIIPFWKSDKILEFGKSEHQKCPILISFFAPFNIDGEILSIFTLY